ncbi:hypothetical protein LP420_40025 [Massilia sp. B-10]|nr:hypothetical protein LP420_40025 [Massilia sp. B-10]
MTAFSPSPSSRNHPGKGASFCFSDLHVTTPDKAGDYLELDGKARSARCGIEAVVVHWGRLRFILNAEGRHRIGVPEFTIAHELKLVELGF